MEATKKYHIPAVVKLDIIRFVHLLFNREKSYSLKV